MDTTAAEAPLSPVMRAEVGRAEDGEEGAQGCMSPLPGANDASASVASSSPATPPPAASPSPGRAVAAAKDRNGAENSNSAGARSARDVIDLVEDDRDSEDIAPCAAPSSPGPPPPPPGAATMTAAAAAAQASRRGDRQQRRNRAQEGHRSSSGGGGETPPGKVPRHEHNTYVSATTSVESTAAAAACVPQQQDGSVAPLAPSTAAAAQAAAQAAAACRASGKWRQTTLNFGAGGGAAPATGVSPASAAAVAAANAAALQATAQAAALQEEVDRLRAQLADRDAAVERSESSTVVAQHALTEFKQLFDAAVLERDDLHKRIERYQVVLKDVMVESAETLRREARREQHNLHFELGQAVVLHSATGGAKEMWCEGNLPRELHRRLREVQERQREVEAHRAELMKRIRALSKPAMRRTPVASSSSPTGAAAAACPSGCEDEQSNGPHHATTPVTIAAAAAAAAATALPDTDYQLIELEEEVQVCKQEIDALSSIQDDLRRQHLEYEAKRTSFLKELSRIREEDLSLFADKKTIGSERYVLMHLLGKGGFSEVWKAFDLVEARIVACKVHRISRDWSRQTREHYLKHAGRELEIMRKLNHPRLTQLFDVFEHDADTFVSVMEFSAGVDLDTYLKRNRTLRESDARVVMMQLIAALRHLAEQDTPIIHYDLKPANILFHSNVPSSLDIKITDFGLSKIIPQAGPSDDPQIELTSVGTGTFYYLPPECFNTSTVQLISSKVDIWAAGVIFFQMLYGKRPFADGQSQKSIWSQNLIVNTARDGVTFPEKPKVSDEAKDVIRRCLCYSAAARPDVVALSQDPYFRPTRRRPRASTAAPGITGVGVASAPPPTAAAALATAAAAAAAGSDAPAGSAAGAGGGFLRPQ